MVEIEGERVLAASCIRAPSDGMVVTTNSARAENDRQKITQPQSGTDFLPAGAPLDEDDLPRLGGGR
jgi:hypothetical protein